jgi:alpha-glucoside transport system substrate-binding protein
MRLRRFRLILVGLVLVLVAAACGGGAESETGDTAAATGGTAGGSEGAAVSGDLSIVHNWAGSEGEAFQAVLDGFTEQHPDVNLTPTQVPFGETTAQMTQQYAAGSAPDVHVALPGLFRQLAAENLLMDLSAPWEEWIANGDYNESLREVASADGTPVAAWFKGNVNGLIWNTPAQLDDLGVQAPDDWDGFTQGLDTIAGDDVEPFAVGGADGWPLTQWFDPFLSRVAGPDVFNGLSRGETGWDDPAVRETLDVFGEFIATYFPDDVLDVGFIDATCSRVEGDAAYQNQGAFINLIAPGECGAEAGSFTFFAMPAYSDQVADSVNISGDLFVVNQATQNPDAAVALVRYLGSAEAQQIWAERGGYIAPNANVAVDAYPEGNDQAAAELWPRTEDVAGLYDLDDAIGGEIQSTEVQALQQFVRDQDVDAFINTMTSVDTRSG